MSTIGKDLPTEERRRLLIQIAKENRKKGEILRSSGGSLAKAQECDRNADYYLNVALSI